MSRTTGLQYDGEKEVEAYEYGLEQRKKGNGQDLDLLIEATDYLDSIGESGIMEEGNKYLPNAITATTSQNKIQSYLLNSNHPRGKEKAKVINSVLGFHYENWQELSDIIYDAVQNSNYTEKIGTSYGDRYIIPIEVKGKKQRTMVLKTVWQIDKGSNIPRLITLTFYKEKEKK